MKSKTLENNENKNLGLYTTENGLLVKVYEWDVTVTQTDKETGITTPAGIVRGCGPEHICNLIKVQDDKKIEEDKAELERYKKHPEYKEARNIIVGALAYSIRMDWRDISKRQDAIKELYGFCWSGPYNGGNMKLDDYYFVKNKFPKLLKYLDLIDDDLLELCCSHHLQCYHDCYNSDCDGSCDCYSDSDSD